MCKLNELLKGKKLYLYGAGNLGKLLLKVLNDKGISVEGFFDIRDLSNVSGIKVYNPFTCGNSIKKDNTLIIVSIFNRDIDFLKIRNQLNSMEFKNVLSFIDIYPYLADLIGPYYWLSNDFSGLSDDSKVNQVYNLFSDDLSKDTFRSIMNTRKNNCYESLPPSLPIEDQYFSIDIPISKFDTFIDCGAYNGDTVDIMRNKGIQFEQIYAFEPDLINFRELSDKMYKYDIKATLYPCGVYSACDFLRFNTGLGEGSNISLSGDTFVQCVALDEVLINLDLHSVYLKMDIEGAELDALKGSEKFIHKYQPDMAICVYHKPEDILDIPLLINSYGDYKFYLRQYGYFGMDLVLYAIK